MNLEPKPRFSLADYLAINRTVGIVLVTVLFFGLGEQLWEQYMPVYLRAKARPSPGDEAIPWKALALVGAYGFLRNLFEGFCYIGGGQLTARLGDRGSLILFAVLTISGYALFLAVPTAWAAIIAALLIMGWEPLSVPVTFTTVGSTLDPSRRGMAFAMQSIQKRLPKIIGPLIAGFVLGAAERSMSDREEAHSAGILALVAVALGLAVGSLFIQIKWMPHRKPVTSTISSRAIVREMHPTLRRLLIAEVLTRWCDWLVREFVVLYIMFVRGVDVETVATLIAVQNTTALLTYLPIGRLTQRVGLQPFIGLTFIFFALFPLTLAVIPEGNAWLVLAFVVYGLREIGEPARKALITSLIPEPVRAKGVGLYWGIRGFAICGASLVGAAIWYFGSPQILLFTAFGLGCLGAAVYYVFCRQPTPEQASPS